MMDRSRTGSVGALGVVSVSVVCSASVIVFDVSCVAAVAVCVITVCTCTVVFYPAIVIVVVVIAGVWVPPSCSQFSVLHYSRNSGSSRI